MDFYQGRNALKKRSESPLEEQRGSFILNQLFPKVKSMRFDKNFITLGFRHFPKEREYDPSRNLYCLDVRRVFRALLLGNSGAGKTINIHRMADIFYHSGYGCAFLTDIKDEMKYASQPQNKLKNILGEDDIPTALPVKVYRPVFLMKLLSERLPRDNIPIKISYKDLNLSELLIALGFDKDDKRNQRDIISYYWNKVESLEGLKNKISEELKQASTRDSIIRSIDPLIDCEAFSENSEGDFVQDINNNFVPVLNVQGYDRVGTGTATLPQIYVSVIQRKIVEALENQKEKRGPIEKRIKKRVVLFIDEAPKFLEPNTWSFKELMKGVDVYRYLGLYMIFAAQTKDRIPEALVQQSSYLFLPYNIDTHTALDLLKMKQFYDFHPAFIRDVAAKLRKLRIHPSGLRQWVCIDTNRKSTDIFWAYPSISAHFEEQG